jgi:hypothetical protein
MRKTAYLYFAGLIVLIVSITIYQIAEKSNSKNKVSHTLFASQEEEKEEGGYKRRLYEWKMLHTGKAEFCQLQTNNQQYIYCSGPFPKWWPNPGNCLRQT